jgi:hypothetical protein
MTLLGLFFGEPFQLGSKWHAVNFFLFQCSFPRYGVAAEGVGWFPSPKLLRKDLIRKAGIFRSVQSDP